MRKILMIAYHFPPLAGSSGIQRTLRFVQHLPSFGWEPLVLTTIPKAYEQTSHDLLGDVPEGVIVHRSFALDTARHLSLGGRYFGWMARPDRWLSWYPAAVWSGLGMIRRYKPDVIWSTYPIATAHMIGSALNRHSGLPWIADFRDPMAQDGYPPDPQTRQKFKRIESDAVRRARWSTFTTPGAAKDYGQRYPDVADRIVVLENGYDEESFVAAATATSMEPLRPGAVTLVHSGIVYPEERDPTALIMALKSLRATGRICPGGFKIRFRAPVHDELLRRLAGENGVEDFIELCPAVPYREALAEMLRADGLLVMQSAGCSAQIPAKIYEYLRARRPILALTNTAGDTAGLLLKAGIDMIAGIDSVDEIVRLLPIFLDAVRENRAPLPSMRAVEQSSRRARAEALVALMDGAVQ